MRKLIRVAVLELLLAPIAVGAQVTLGARVGVAGPLGHYADELSLGDMLGPQFPIQIDVLYRFTPEWAVGLYGSYGRVELADNVKEACDRFGMSCSANVRRLGLEGSYVFTHPTRPVVPWVGLGFGLEWLETEVAAVGGGDTVTSTATGFEWLDFQLGWDFQPGGRFALGVYGNVCAGRYLSVEGEKIDSQSNHVWLGFGLRGRFDL